MKQLGSLISDPESLISRPESIGQSKINVRFGHKADSTPKTPLESIAPDYSH